MQPQLPRTTPAQNLCKSHRHISNHISNTMNYQERSKLIGFCVMCVLYIPSLILKNQTPHRRIWEYRAKVARWLAVGPSNQLIDPKRLVQEVVQQMWPRNAMVCLAISEIDVENEHSCWYWYDVDVNSDVHIHLISVVAFDVDVHVDLCWYLNWHWCTVNVDNDVDVDNSVMWTFSIIIIQSQFWSCCWWSNRLLRKVWSNWDLSCKRLKNSWGENIVQELIPVCSVDLRVFEMCLSEWWDQPAPAKSPLHLKVRRILEHSWSCTSTNFNILPARDRRKTMDQGDKGNQLLKAI